MKKVYFGLAAIIVLVALVFTGIQVNQAKFGPQAVAAIQTDTREGCTNCDSHDNNVSRKTAAAANDGDYYGKVNAQGKASGTSLMAAYKADTLYTCPMHPQIITDNPNAGCPTCGMSLTEMSSEDVKQLQDSAPKGCPMDPVVVSGDSDTENCSICGMKLMDPKKGHGGMHG